MHISDWALDECADWGFPWRKILGQTRPYLRRFEIAIWSDGRLLALAVGRASRGPDNVTIHFIERAPRDNPLAGFTLPIVVDAADNYAKILERQRVKVKDPKPWTIVRYENLGFSLAETYRKATYWDRRVGHDRVS
jgi:hypothetical protein